MFQINQYITILNAAKEILNKNGRENNIYAKKIFEDACKALNDIFSNSPETILENMEAAVTAENYIPPITENSALDKDILRETEAAGESDDNIMPTAEKTPDEAPEDEIDEADIEKCMFTEDDSEETEESQSVSNSDPELAAAIETEEKKAEISPESVKQEPVIEIEAEASPEQAEEPEPEKENLPDENGYVYGIDYIGRAPREPKASRLPFAATRQFADIEKARKMLEMEIAESQQAEDVLQQERNTQQAEKTTPESDKDDIEADRPNDDDFPSEMHQKDFTFFYDHIFVTAPSGKEEEAEIIISPMSLKEGSDKIIAWINTNTKTVTEISGPKSSIVAHLDSCDLILSGKITAGDFKASVKLKSGDINRGYSIDEDSKNINGKRGHIMLYDEGVEIHLFPISFNNNEDGNADFFYYMKLYGEESTGDSLGESVTFEHEEMTKRLLAKWDEKEHMLYSGVLKW